MAHKKPSGGKQSGGASGDKKLGGVGGSKPVDVKPHFKGGGAGKGGGKK